MRRRALSPSESSARCPQSSHYSFMLAEFLFFGDCDQVRQLVGPASDTSEQRLLFYLAFKFPLLLQIPQTGELL